MAARIALLAALVVCVAAAPAQAARDRCTPTTAGAPLSVRIASPQAPDDWYTTLVACDRRTGRERVLRRAVLRARTKRGRAIVDASVAGRRVAWLESIHGRRRGAAAVYVADGRSGRIVQRRYVLDRAIESAYDPSGVALTTRGELAWSVGSSADDMRVVLALPGAAPRELARGLLHGIGLEDDGTLVWRDGRDGQASYDLPGRDFGAGCPKRRSGYAPTGPADGTVVFTADTWADQPFSGQVLRACDAESGVDAIVGVASFDGDIGGESIEGVGGGNGWAAVVEWSRNRYDQCGLATLRAVRIADRARGRQTSQSGCDPPAQFSERTLVTAAGAPVWIARGAVPRLMAVDAERRAVELDRGDIGDLGTDGGDVVWTNAGEPRRARP